MSLKHTPYFDHYDMKAPGEFYNWGYGPAMTYEHEEGDYSTLPSFTFEEEDGVNETVYSTGWHIHAPADHTVQGDRSKAELHYVHVDSEGHPRAVLAFRIDPGNSESAFFDSLPDLISYRATEERINATFSPNAALEQTRTRDTSFNPNTALAQVKDFDEFWTYKGSLTSPPCTEGVRWFVARGIMFIHDDQMRNLLNVSRYSARDEQQVWRHQINV